MRTLLRRQALALVVFSTLGLRSHPSASAPPLTPGVPSASSMTRAAPLGYVEPAPVRVYRSYVYGTLKSRRNKIVTIESLVTTSSAAVAQGETALLERKVEAPSPGPDFSPLADVVIKRLLAKGRIELEIQLERPEATGKHRGRPSFAVGQKVRLQIDRQTPPPT